MYFLFVVVFVCIYIYIYIYIVMAKNIDTLGKYDQRL